jgi:hypothetical protein
VELPLFEQVGELTRTLVPEELGSVRFRAHRRGVKVWLDVDKAPRDHFEAQMVPRGFVDGTDGAVLEIGFHAEHGDPAVNDATLAALLTAERKWRRRLGAEAECGAFLGQSDWRRVSEVWFDLDPDDPETAFEVAARLAEYVSELAPHLSPPTT